MNEVYELDDGRSLTLYMEGNRILSLVTPMRRGSLPSMQKNDCLGKLYSTAYHGNIYYVYENLSHQIVLDTVNPGAPKVVLSPGPDASRFDGLMLREISGHLCLLYQVWNPLTETYNLCCQDPITQELPDIIYKGHPRRLRLQWIDCEDGEYMLATTVVPREEDDPEELWFKIEDGHFFQAARREGGDVQPLKAMEAVREEYEARLAAEKSDMEETIRQLKGRCALLESAGADYEARMEETTARHSVEVQQLKAGYEAQQAETTARHSEEMQQLKAGYEAQLEETTARHNEEMQQLKASYEAQLESAKKQYAELAKTAVELQKVGRLWRDKYLGES